MHFPEQSILSLNVSSENNFRIASAGPMASINPSLKKNQEIITKVRRNTVEKLTDDLKYVVHVFWYQSTFTVFPSCNCVFEKKKKKKTPATRKPESQIIGTEMASCSPTSMFPFPHSARFLNFS